MANENYDLSELTEEFRKLREELSSFGQTVSSSTKSMNTGFANASQAAKDAAAATKASTKADDDYAKSKKELVNALKRFGSSLNSAAQSTENNQSKYAAGLTMAGDSIGKLVGQFGLLGKATEYTIKAFTMAADAVMKQNDAIFNSYDSLGKLGATIGLTTDAVMTLGIKAGYSEKTLESLYRPAKELGQQLVALGGSSSGGIKAFAEIANIGETAKQNFRALGYSQEEVTEMQSNYVKEIARVGGTLAKTPKQLSEESQKYVYQLTALADLTGKSVKEQQQARDLAMANRNLNAYMAELAGREAKAREAGNFAEAERLKKQQENTKAVAAHITATEDSEVALAKIQSMATDGAVVYDKNNAILIQNGYNVDKLNESLRSGKSAMEALAINATENSGVQKRAVETFGENIYRLGEASIDIQKFTMQSNEARASMLSNQQIADRYYKLSEEERKKIDNMSMENAIKALAEEKKNNDTRVGTDNARQEAERSYKKAMDELTLLLSKFVNPALTLMYKAINLVSKTLLDIIEVFSTFGDIVEDVMDGFKGILFWFRDNPVTRKILGLNEVTVEERKALEDRKELRRKETEERRERRFPGEGKKQETNLQQYAPSASPEFAAPAMEPAASSTRATTAPAAPAQAAPTTSGTSKPSTVSGATSPSSETLGMTGTAGTMGIENILAFGQNSGSKRNFEQLNERLKQSVIAAATEFNAQTGQKLIINSAKRDSADQQRIWDESVAAGRPGRTPKGRPIARPGMSKHEHGLAVDIQNFNNQLAVSAMNKQGLFQTVPQDPVHFEMQAKFGGIFDGPKSGYPVMLHGSEMVLPIKNLTEMFNLAQDNITKTELPAMFNNTTNNPTNTSDNTGLLEQLVEVMSTKLDSVIQKLSDSNDTQDKLLKYSMV